MSRKEPQPKKSKIEIPDALINLRDELAKNFDKSLLEKIHVYDVSKYNMTKTEQKIKLNGSEEFGLFDKIDDLTNFESLYNNLEPSKFGKEKSYAYDESVRKSRETKNFEIKRVSALIPAEFAGKYDFELYKFVVYGPGDFFTMHVDTPREGLAYSMVYTMNTNFVGGELHFKGIEQSFGGNKIVIFDPAIPHEVRKVTSGYKLSILVNFFRKHEFSLKKMDLKLDSNIAKDLFRQIDFKSLGHINIWFSHPLQDNILEILDEKGIKYISAVTSDEEKIAIEEDEWRMILEEAKESAENDYIDMEDLINKCSDTHPIHFVLCNQNVMCANMSRYYGSTGNSPMQSDYTFDYFDGFLIML